MATRNTPEVLQSQPAVMMEMPVEFGSNHIPNKISATSTH